VKYAFWILLILAAVALPAGGFWLGTRLAEAPGTGQVTHVTTPVETRIIREYEPAVVETVWAGQEPHEVATWAARIDSNDVAVDIDLRYDERANVFDLIRFDARGLRDSVYFERPAAIRPLRFTAGMGVGFRSSNGKPELASADIEAGVLLWEKYRITAWADTRETFGIRLGVNF
jgi:hypothetical protein